MYHLSLSSLCCVLTGVTFEILTPPYYERHLAHSISYKRKFLFSTPPFVTSCYLCTSLCMYHLSLSGLASSIVLLEILTPPYYERHLAHWRISYKRKFQFLNTSICYELLLCVHHYACTTSSCTKFV
jgi:hypothetical protein